MIKVQSGLFPTVTQEVPYFGECEKSTFWSMKIRQFHQNIGPMEQRFVPFLHTELAETFKHCLATVYENPKTLQTRLSIGVIYGGLGDL